MLLICCSALNAIHYFHWKQTALIQEVQQIIIIICSCVYPSCMCFFNRAVLKGLILQKFVFDIYV